MTLGELYSQIEGRLLEAGIEDHRSDAALVVCEICDVSRSDLLGRPETELAEELAAKALEIAERRAERIPLQHLIGRTGFMGLDFLVRRGVLIPRPDTEILVEAALKALHDGDRVLDLCTGTGCILISLMNYSNECEGIGTDINPEAVALAKENAAVVLPQEKLDNISFFLGDLYEAVPEGKRFDMIVSNPPYIESSVIPTLMPEVREHDPLLALDGGEDGLDFYWKITAGAPGYLTKGGELLFEIGYDQGEAVSALMKEAGFTEVEVLRDYGGSDRVVKGRLGNV